jgi:hypothetical protein
MLAKGHAAASRQVEALVITRRPGDYDAAFALPEDLREIAERSGSTSSRWMGIAFVTSYRIPYLHDDRIIVADGPTTNRTAITRASSRSRLPELQLSAPDRDAAHGGRHLLPLRQVRRDLDSREAWNLERSTLKAVLFS